MVHTSFSSVPKVRVSGLLHTLSAAGALALALTLGGCASAPPPNQAMNLAQSQLQSARDAGAADYDPVDYGFAQDKFQQAQAAMAARKYAKAADLASESQVDAQLAQTKANLGTARTKIQSKLDANAALREQGAQAAAAAAAEFAKPLAMPAGASSAPVPAGSASLPAAAPVEDMPAPSASTLSAPQPGQGFQAVPTDNPPQAGNHAGFQPVGGQP